MDKVAHIVQSCTNSLYSDIKNEFVTKFGKPTFDDREFDMHGVQGYGCAWYLPSDKDRCLEFILMKSDINKIDHVGYYTKDSSINYRIKSSDTVIGGIQWEFDNCKQQEKSNG